MDYSRPNHIPTSQDEAAAERAEYRMLMVFAAVVLLVTVVATLVFSAQIS